MERYSIIRDNSINLLFRWDLYAAWFLRVWYSKFLIAFAMIFRASAKSRVHFEKDAMSNCCAWGKVNEGSFFLSSNAI